MDALHHDRAPSQSSSSSTPPRRRFLPGSRHHHRKQPTSPHLYASRRTTSCPHTKRYDDQQQQPPPSPKWSQLARNKAPVMCDTSASASALHQQYETTRIISHLLAGVIIQWRRVVEQLNDACVPLTAEEVARSEAHPTSALHSSAFSSISRSHADTTTSPPQTYLHESLHFDVQAHTTWRELEKQRQRSQSRRQTRQQGCDVHLRDAHPYLYQPTSVQQLNCYMEAEEEEGDEAAKGAERPQASDWRSLTPSVQWVPYVVCGKSAEDRDNGVSQEDRYDGVLYATPNQPNRRHLSRCMRCDDDDEDAAVVDVDDESRLRMAVLRGMARSADKMGMGMRQVQQVLPAFVAALRRLSPSSLHNSNEQQTLPSVAHSLQSASPRTADTHMASTPTRRRSHQQCHHKNDCSSCLARTQPTKSVGHHRQHAYSPSSQSPHNHKQQRSAGVTTATPHRCSRSLGEPRGSTLHETTKTIYPAPPVAQRTWIYSRCDDSEGNNSGLHYSDKRTFGGSEYPSMQRRHRRERSPIKNTSTPTLHGVTSITERGVGLPALTGAAVVVADGGPRCPAVSSLHAHRHPDSRRKTASARAVPQEMEARRRVLHRMTPTSAVKESPPLLSVSVSPASSPASAPGSSPTRAVVNHNGSARDTAGNHLVGPDAGMKSHSPHSRSSSSAATSNADYVILAHPPSLEDIAGAPTASCGLAGQQASSSLLSLASMLKAASPAPELPISPTQHVPRSSPPPSSPEQLTPNAVKQPPVGPRFIAVRPLLSPLDERTIHAMKQQRAKHWDACFPPPTDVRELHKEDSPHEALGPAATYRQNYVGQGACDSSHVSPVSLRHGMRRSAERVRIAAIAATTVAEAVHDSVSAADRGAVVALELFPAKLSQEASRPVLLTPSPKQRDLPLLSPSPAHSPPSSPPSAAAVEPPRAVVEVIPAQSSACHEASSKNRTSEHQVTINDGHSAELAGAAHSRDEFVRRAAVVVTEQVAERNRDASSGSDPPAGACHLGPVSNPQPSHSATHESSSDTSQLHHHSSNERSGGSSSNRSDITLLYEVANAPPSELDLAEVGEGSNYSSVSSFYSKIEECLTEAEADVIEARAPCDVKPSN
ncbi:hypothetical protein ABL78_2263 [Leptomonas seymouri]|uniref:Uncharacterized protein n=1 Tax=Leptomonas seymouri TaxID=5684 RepID=A0A0N0P7D3_LEPSE|nr:hypothetical protein ABL78_2263 [Leptomonas seymouri]|eukprot:KPI88659.1 hypothetical protein ABL78_2263 [Leptomonas seymouri]